MRKKIKVDVQICRRDNDNIILAFTDSEARIQFLEVTMGCADFSRAITNMYTTGMDAEVRGLDLVGTTGESKVEWIEHEDRGRYRRHGSGRAPSEEAALAPLEINGWKGRVEDLRNHHNREVLPNGEIGYRVVFTRNVEKS